MSRLFSIGKLGLGVAKSEAEYHLKKSLDRNEQLQKLSTQIKQMQMITQTLGEMKGAVMKVGQMLSLYDIPGLPDEVREILSQLQKQAPSLPFEDMRVVIEETVPEFFSHVRLESEIPIAAASIGQVYKGHVTNGPHKDTAVAIKVQIPGMDKIVQSDVKNLNVLSKVFSPWITQREMKAILKEIKDHLLAECDYIQEAKNIAAFRKIYPARPHIIFPDVIPDLSSKHVLTMTYLEGVDFKTFLKQTPSQITRNEIMQMFIEFYMDQIFNHSVVHADPQFGNYIFQDKTIGVVDFGCVKYFNPSFIHNIVVFIQACMDRDKEAIHAGYRALGLATAKDSSRLYDYLDEFIDIAQVTYKKERYQYGEYKVIHKIFQALPRMLMQKNLHYPPDFLMLERTVAGLYFLAEKLGATLPLKKTIVDHILDPQKIKKGYI